MAQKSLQINGATYTIGYEILNPGQTQTVVFLHGWGADRQLMKQAFGKTLPQFRHLYIDLPGFGTSTVPAVMRSDDYAAVIRRFLSEVGIGGEVTVVGHSFGGKIAALLEPAHLVLVGAAGIVWQKPWRVRAVIALAKLLNRFGLDFLRRAFAARDAKGLNPLMYETFKAVVNEEFSAVYGAYRGDVLLCWGESDTATPMKSAHKMAELMPQSRLVTFAGDHFFFLQHAEAVAKEIAAIQSTRSGNG